MERRESGGGGRALWIWVAVAAFAIVAVTGLALFITGEPWFCATCHEMRPQVDGWRAGAHEDVSCFACHSDPGVLGYLRAHVGQGLRDVWVHFTRRPAKVTPTGQIVPPARCLACHGDEPRGEAPPFPPADRFPNHPPRTEYCPECHRDSVHGTKR